MFCLTKKRRPIFLPPFGPTPSSWRLPLGKPRQCLSPWRRWPLPSPLGFQAVSKAINPADHSPPACPFPMLQPARWRIGRALASGRPNLRGLDGRRGQLANFGQQPLPLQKPLAAIEERLVKVLEPSPSSA